MRDRKTESLSAFNAQGQYELVEPIDTKLMELLPDEGTLFADLYPLGETVKNLAKKLSTKEAVVPSTVVSNRLRILAVQGLVTKTKSVTSGGGSTVWQRKKAATDLLASRRKNGGRENDTSG